MAQLRVVFSQMIKQRITRQIDIIFGIQLGKTLSSLRPYPRRHVILYRLRLWSRTMHHWCESKWPHSGKS